MPLPGVAAMVTGFVTAVVQVAVTAVAGEDERWTDGSLAVQLKPTRSAGTAQTGLFWN